MTSRQEEIIDRSIEIIATRGIQGLTIRNLSLEIGITEPAIYRHFRSKTDILLAILDKFEEILFFMNEAPVERKATAPEKLERIFLRIIEIFSKEPSHISVIFSEEIFKNDRVLKERITGILKKKRKVIEEILREGQEKGEIRKDIDPRTLSLIVMGSLRFMIKQWDLHDQHENLLKEGKKLIEGIQTILKN